MGLMVTVQWSPSQVWCRPAWNLAASADTSEDSLQCSSSRRSSGRPPASDPACNKEIPELVDEL